MLIIMFTSVMVDILVHTARASIVQVVHVQSMLLTMPR
jgi:hypothetical protein